MQNIIFIHGLESSGQGFKGRLFQKVLPGCLTPNFEEYNSTISNKSLLKKRMEQLLGILKEKHPWIIIGSSFGGLMATIYSCQNPDKVSKLILLAPYISTSELDPKKYSPIDIPVIVFHGKYDKVVSVRRSRTLAGKLFTNLAYNIVNDDHFLHKTVKILDWNKLIKSV